MNNLEHTDPKEFKRIIKWAIENLQFADRELSARNLIPDTDAFEIKDSINELEKLYNDTLFNSVPELLEIAELVIDLDSPEDMNILFDMASKVVSKVKGETE